MAARVADRPHEITIILSLLAAFISAIGVYIAYQKATLPPSTAPQEKLAVPSPEDKAKQEREEATKAGIQEVKRKQAIEEIALGIAKKNILGLWTCTATEPTKITVPSFDVYVYPDDSFELRIIRVDHGKKEQSKIIIPYKFTDSTHIQVRHVFNETMWDTYTIGVDADHANQHVHSDNDDNISCIRKSP